MRGWGEEETCREDRKGREKKKVTERREKWRIRKQIEEEDRRGRRDGEIKEESDGKKGEMGR